MKNQVKMNNADADDAFDDIIADAGDAFADAGDAEQASGLPGSAPDGTGEKEGRSS